MGQKLKSSWKWYKACRTEKPLPSIPKFIFCSLKPSSESEFCAISNHIQFVFFGVASLSTVSQADRCTKPMFRNLVGFNAKQCSTCFVLLDFEASHIKLVDLSFDLCSQAHLELFLFLFSSTSARSCRCLLSRSSVLSSTSTENVDSDFEWRGPHYRVTAPLQQQAALKLETR